MIEQHILEVLHCVLFLFKTLAFGIKPVCLLAKCLTTEQMSKTILKKKMLMHLHFDYLLELVKFKMATAPPQLSLLATQKIAIAKPVLQITGLVKK